MNVLDERDLDWVGAAIDIIEAAAGQPWRVALEQLDDTRRAAQPAAPKRFAAVVGAIQRVVGGRARNAKLARAVRHAALGLPVFTPAEREARIAAAASALDLTCAAVEAALWSDLPKERPIELPAGRPSELEVTAFANVQLLQRAVRRAQSVTIRIWGDGGPLIRAAASRGLLVTTSLGRTDETVLDIVGPLALCHGTSVYGRALAGLVPLLVECERFTLEVSAAAATHAYRVEIASPVLLPAVPAHLNATSAAVIRLVRELRQLEPALAVATSPAPIRAGDALVCPDLAIRWEERTRYVELVGFWTAEYLERKLARYRDAGLDVRLCINDARGCADDHPPSDANVLRYTRHVDARVIAAWAVGVADATRRDDMAAHIVLT